MVSNALKRAQDELIREILSLSKTVSVSIVFTTMGPLFLCRCIKLSIVHDIAESGLKDMELLQLLYGYFLQLSALHLFL